MCARPGKVNRNLRLAWVWLLVGMSVAGCRTVPIVDPVEAPLFTPEGADVEEVDEAIWRAGRKLGWEIDRVVPGSLRGELRVRHHSATVTIRHDTRTLRVAYESSENLLHQGDTIHGNYNMWIARLVEKIQQEPVWPAHSRR